MFAFQHHEEFRRFRFACTKGISTNVPQIKAVCYEELTWIGNPRSLNVCLDTLLQPSARMKNTLRHQLPRLQVGLCARFYHFLHPRSWSTRQDIQLQARSHWVGKLWRIPHVSDRVQRMGSPDTQLRQCLRWRSIVRWLFPFCLFLGLSARSRWYPFFPHIWHQVSCRNIREKHPNYIPNLQKWWPAVPRKEFRDRSIPTGGG